MTVEKHIEDFIRLHDVDAKIQVFSSTVSNSNSSAQNMGVSLDRIVKTVVFYDTQKKLYAVILRGKHKVNIKAVEKHFGVSSLTLLPREEVLARTGYPAGGVPPFDFDASFILDADLRDDEVVCAGGGYHLRFDRA